MTIDADLRNKNKSRTNNVVSRVAADLILVAGGESRAAKIHQFPSRLGGRCHLPGPPGPTLSELFALHPRDGGWAGFLLAQLAFDKPLLWVQDRMAILESGRIHPPGLPTENLVHVEARDANDALWTMEDGLRCSCLSAVIGELWGDPKALDFTATRRLAVASERSGTPCWLVRLGRLSDFIAPRSPSPIPTPSTPKNQLPP